MIKYPVREMTSSWVSDFSTQVIGADARTGFSDFELTDGYHSIGFDRFAAARRFEEQASPLLDRTLSKLPELAEELGEAVLGGDGGFIAAVGELSWLIAHQNHAYVAVQISARRRAYVVAQPIFTLIRNIDRRPLALRLLDLPESFEDLGRIDVEAAATVTLLPGQAVFVNGFEQLSWFEESGIAFACASTLPLGAYEATYLVEGGERVGLFSTDLRLSSAEVALRTMAAAGWAGAAEMAATCARHPLKELRWSALNYAWRTNVPGLADMLQRLAGDPDPGLARLAQQCLVSLQQEAAAA